MVYDRYSRGDFGGRDPQDYGRDYGSGRDYTYSSAREYGAAGAFDGDRNRDRYRERGYGSQNRERDDDRDYTGNFVPYGERGDRGRDQGYGSGDGYARRGGNRGWDDRDQDTRDWGDRGSGGMSYGQSSGDRYGRGSYGSDDYRGMSRGGGRTYEGGDRYRGQGFGGQRQRIGADRQRGGYSGTPQGYDYDDRGFFARAGDEVRSWFGDDDAERRREADMRYDERNYGDRQSYDRDSDYGSWRRTQIAALDRDYDEYRRENRSKFENEFSTWRSGRQTQRDALNNVKEHMDVVGSDGSHVGTVDKVRGDRILLTKNDKDADGHHHSIPSSWIATVDTNVTLTKSADDAKKHWRDEENNSALFGYGDRTENRSGDKDRDNSRTDLNRSFSGTY